MKTRFGFHVMALVIATAAPGIALANDDTLTRSAVVRTADIDLRTAGGVAILDRRIKIAVNRVCEPVDFSLHARALSIQCQHESMKRAVEARRVAIARAESRQSGIAVANAGQ